MAVAIYSAITILVVSPPALAWRLFAVSALEFNRREAALASGDAGSAVYTLRVIAIRSLPAAFMDLIDLFVPLGCTDWNCRAVLALVLAMTLEALARFGNAVATGALRIWTHTAATDVYGSGAKKARQAKAAREAEY